jgi:hypothetical protein
MNIQEAIKMIAQRELARAEMYCVLCTVNSVDTSERTCEVTPLNGKADLFDVRFQAELSLNVGLFIEPKVNSTVLVAFINSVQAAVVMCSEIENIYIDTYGDTIFNGGQNDGMVKVGDLVTKLNNLENDVNNLKTAVSGWTPVPNDGGAALKLALATWYAQTLTPTQQSDLENTKVQH